MFRGSGGEIVLVSTVERATVCSEIVEAAALGFRGSGGARVRRSGGENGENEVR